MTRKVSIQGMIAGQVIGTITATPFGKYIQKGVFRKHPMEPKWICPRKYSYSKVNFDYFQAEDVYIEGCINGKVILQLHGGGYIGPIKNSYRKFAVRYSDISGGAEVLTLDYRVAPEHPFPAALYDAVEAYRWLTEKRNFSPKNIIVVGDSSGGGLVLALCMYLRDNGFELPAAVITMSAWTDLTNRVESRDEKLEDDPLFGRTKDNMIYNSAYIGDNDPKNPYISPIYGSFKDFPPMLMQVGTEEVLLSDTVLVATKAQKEGIDVTLSVYQGMFHVFQMSGDYIPESKRAWQEVQDFILRIWPSNPVSDT